MAKYNREFLVPYLRDVLSAEVLCDKTNREVNSYRNKIISLKKTINQRIEYPSKPVRGQYTYNHSYFWSHYWGAPIIALVLFLIGSYLRTSRGFLEDLFPSLFSFVGWTFTIIAILVSLLFVIMFLGSKIDDSNAYRRALQEYNQTNAKIARFINSIPSLNNELQKYQNRLFDSEEILKNAESLKNKLYNVNVIPRRYRTIHCAYYLYDFFESGRENDLDSVIQTMLLDKIVQQLSKIIEQNEDIILNQRITIAILEESNQEQRNFHNQQLKKMARIEQNQERQNDYLQMIDLNQETTNFMIFYNTLNKK